MPQNQYRVLHVQRSYTHWQAKQEVIIQDGTAATAILQTVLRLITNLEKMLASYITTIKEVTTSKISVPCLPKLLSRSGTRCLTARLNRSC